MTLSEFFPPGNSNQLTVRQATSGRRSGRRALIRVEALALWRPAEGGGLVSANRLAGRASEAVQVEAHGRETAQTRRTL